MTDLAAVIAELHRRATHNVQQFLYPAETIELVPGIPPHGHKLFEGVVQINARDMYPAHLEFMKAGAKFNQRFCIAGNRVGKTLMGCLEVMYHATGLYPYWWEGKVFDHPQDWWVGGDTSETVIEILQPYFLGEVGEFGTGLIPKRVIDFETLKDAQKARTSVGAIRVQHTSGGLSTITFKSYGQGRKMWQGTAKCVLLDEEPPEDVYGEALMRTATGDNILIGTFTPLNGETKLIKALFPDGDYDRLGDIGNGRWVSRIAMDDVKHLSEQKIQEILSSYPDYQRKARRMGYPTLAGGAIFPVAKENWTCEPFRLPEHWPRCYGLDTGNRTAAVWLAHDVDADEYYAYGEYYIENALPDAHCSAIKARGDWMHGAADTASHSDNPTDQQNLFNMYVQGGLKLQNANKAVEAGIYGLQQLVEQRRLKVFITCVRLIGQLQNYRRDEKGNIVKAGDDLVDALRYAKHTPGIMKTELEATRKPERTGRRKWNG